MKTLILMIAFLLVFWNAKSQITLGNTFSTGVNNNFYFSLVKLSTSGYKYLNPNYSTNTITLYNLNNTVFKTITFPPGLTPSCHYISETLFNTDPSDVELIIRYQSSGGSKILIINEFGTILFSRDSVDFAGYQNQLQTPISYTPSGVKLLLYNRYTDNVSVYNLPGSLVCNDYTDGAITGKIDNNYNQPVISVFPNPSIDEIKISYELPSGSPKAYISFYTIEGKELRTYEIDNHINFITINKEALGVLPGIYLYKIFNSAKVISSEKIIFE